MRSLIAAVIVVFGTTAASGQTTTRYNIVAYYPSEIHAAMGIMPFVKPIETEVVGER